MRKSGTLSEQPPLEDGHVASIPCNEAAGRGALWLTGLVVPLLGFAAIWIAGVPFRFDQPAREFNPLVFIPVVASAAGVLIMMKALMITARVHRFGVSTLTLDKRARVGGVLRGRVTSTVDVTAREWQLSLSCVETIKAAGSKQVYQSDVMRWHVKTTVPGEGQPLGSGLAIDIPIPADALALTDPIERARRKRGSLRWTLTLRGPQRGHDYLASFDIPIRTEAAHGPV